MADNFSVVSSGFYLDSDIPLALYIADVAVNVVFSAIAVLGNTFIMAALWKLSSLQIHSVLKVFLFSLASADLGVGAVVQPLYIAAVLTAMTGRLEASRTIGAVFYVVNWLLPYISCATVTGIAIDRYLALYFRLRYRILVTTKRVITLLILLWILTIAGTSFVLWNHIVYNALAIVTIAVFLFSTTVCYLKIYLTLRHQNGRFRAVVPLGLSSGTRPLSKRHNFNLARYKKTVNNMLYVYLAFIVCYLPLFCILIVIHVRGVNRIIKILRFVSATLIFVNSSLNPLLYCWKIREIRQVVLAAIAKLLCCCSWRQSSFHHYLPRERQHFKCKIAFTTSRL